MNAILGKITKVRELSSRAAARPRRRTRGAAGPLHRLEVSFRPTCVMPGRTKAPEWLKDQVLKVTRRVADPREVGGAGDSIVLTPAESEKWLFPLRVEPAIVYGREKLPARVRVMLRWWKKDKPGEFTVCANGLRRVGTFAPAGRRGRGGTSKTSRPRRAAGRSFTASFAPRDFFASPPSLPVSFEVSFDKLKAACTVLPEAGCCHRKLLTRYGERHRVESDWYALEVCPTQAGGGISMLREKARGVDHFRDADELIHDVFHHGGHADRVRFGRSDRMRRVAMTSAAARREAGATRLRLEGLIDEGRNIGTTVAYTVFDRLPLVLIQRDLMMHAAKKKDGGKDDGRPAEPIDETEAVSLGFRAACLVERNAHSGSRVLSVDGERFSVLRYTQVNDELWDGWRLTDGWAVMEHPARRECLMYLVDGRSAPVLCVSLGERVLALESHWLPRPIRPERGAGFAAALCAGELCGAGVAGAWVACRRGAPGGGVRCAVVGRFRDAPTAPAARITVGPSSVRQPLERLLLPAIGAVHVASAHLPEGRMDADFDATVAGIPARRLT